MILLLLSSLLSLNAFGISQFSDCNQQHYWSTTKCGATAVAATCIQQASQCATTCKSVIDYHNSTSRTTRGKTLILQPSELSAATSKLSSCVKFVTDKGGADPTVSTDDADPSGDDDDATPAVTDPARQADDQKKCLEFKAKTDTKAKLDALIKTPEVLASCVSVCKSATEGKPETDAKVKELAGIGTKCYEAIPNDDLGTASEDPPADENPPADDAVDTPSVSDNTPQQQNPSSPFSMPNFGGTPSVGTDLSKFTDVVNWATGPTPDNGVFDSVAAATSQAANSSAGFSPLAGVSRNLGTASLGFPPPKKDDGGGSNTGGGAGGASGGGMGGQGGGGSPSGPGRSGGGSSGGRTSVAASQLSKVGQNAFYSGGGSLATVAGGKKPEPNNKRKPAYSPKYSPKSNDGGMALARMFGKPKADFGNHGYATYGQSCLNTVFCGIESRFQEMLADYDTSDVSNVASDAKGLKKIRNTASDKNKD